LNKRQISVIRHFLSVIIVTLLFVFGLINLRDGINRREALREMTQFGEAVLKYRQNNGSLPPEAWTKPLLDSFSRIEVKYRATMILYDSPPNTILAYSKQRSYSLFVKAGYIVLRLNGAVDFMRPDEFEPLLKKQEADRNLELYRLYGLPQTK
jgi:hypothetical protein